MIFYKQRGAVTAEYAIVAAAAMILSVFLVRNFPTVFFGRWAERTRRVFLVDAAALKAKNIFREIRER